MTKEFAQQYAGKGEAKEGSGGVGGCGGRDGGGSGESKRAAVQSLLTSIHTAFDKVTVQAPDWRMLKTFWALRDLYCPSRR